MLILSELFRFYFRHFHSFFHFYLKKLQLSIDFAYHKVYNISYKMKVVVYLDRKSLINKLESEFRQALIDIEQGNTILLEDFDWGLPMHIAEAKGEYHAADV